MGRGHATPAERLRSVALELPEASEEDHHGRASYRVRGKIFATLWDETHANVMVDEAGILTAAEANPSACREFWWGKRLGAIQVDLERVGDGELRELLADAWERKAPLRLARGHPGDRRLGGVK